jgi:hypothetical protein
MQSFERGRIPLNPISALHRFHCITELEVTVSFSFPCVSIIICFIPDSECPRRVRKQTLGGSSSRIISKIHIALIIPLCPLCLNVPLFQRREASSVQQQEYFPVLKINTKRKRYRLSSVFCLHALRRHSEWSIGKSVGAYLFILLFKA